jgi:hypothetical protein
VIHATADVVYWDGDAVCVVDWKTGSSRNLEPASENGQLRILALAAARAYGATCAKGAIAHVSEEGVKWDWAEYDALTLDEFAVEVAAAFRGLPAAEPCPGSHCEKRWCPLRDACPARVAVVRREDETLAQALENGIQTPEDVAACYDKLVTVESLCEAIRGRIREVTTKAGIVELPAGRRLCMYEQAGRESADVGAIRGLAKALGATDVELDACKKKGAPFLIMKEVKARGAGKKG